MSVTSVVNLSDGLLGGPATQDTQGLPGGAHTSSSTSPSALPQDEFTPSSLTESTDTTAQAAGLFSAPKTPPPSNANSLLAQPATNNADDAATATTSAAQGNVSQQTQLDALNNALAALGLSAADIQKVDQVASLINEFNPTSFTSLVYQLEALAQNSSAQSTQAPASPLATPSASQNSAPASPSAANGQTSSLSAIQLQLSFSNPTGQSVQVQTPVLSTAAQAAPKAFAASASASSSPKIAV